MGTRGRGSRGVRRRESNQQVLRNTPNLEGRSSDGFQESDAFLTLCTPLWNVTTLFFLGTCKVLHFLIFCLPTQPNLELPANNNSILYRDFVPFLLLE